MAKNQKSPRAAVTQLKGRAHFHCCRNRSCRAAIACTCETPHDDPLCNTCRGVRASLWAGARAPRECCRENVRQITYGEEIATYKLAGPGPWFICRTCARQTGWPQGFQPTEETA